MLEVKRMLERQQAWQASRRLLSWPEKLRMVEALAETLRVFAAVRTSSRDRFLPGRDAQPPTNRRDTS